MRRRETSSTVGFYTVGFYTVRLCTVGLYTVGLYTVGLCIIDALCRGLSTFSECGAKQSEFLRGSHSSMLCQGKLQIFAGVITPKSERCFASQAVLGSQFVKEPKPHLFGFSQSKM